MVSDLIDVYSDHSDLAGMFFQIGIIQMNHITIDSDLAQISTARTNSCDHSFLLHAL